MMTKKRFTILYETEENAMEWDLIDNQEDRLIVTGNGKAICDLLNKLHEENQDLETKKEDAEYELLYLKEKYEEVIEKNEQLKNKIDVLEDDNETYHKSLEQLNLYTKRFIPTKCTNEFKDCKTNRYYWLDHEGNFEGCLELLNLLDCEREVLKSENRQLKGRLTLYEEQIKGDVE